VDIGSGTTRVIVGEFLKGEKNPKIIGVGEARTKGVRHGYVINSSDALVGVRQALGNAEKTSGVKIKRVFVSVNGSSLRGDTSSGSAIISKADGEVTALDIKKALEEAENNLNLSNRKVIRSFPLSYRLDGKEVLGRLEGIKGIKLEIKALFITYSIAHLEDLLEVLAEAGVETIDVIPSPIAASQIVLSEKEKIVGTALVDIGGETSSLAVFENGLLTSLATFPIGGEDITNDIALGLKIPLEKAENLKLGNGSEEYSKKKLDEIIEARLGDIFELIENHLKKIKRNELLPAGVVFIGGGSNIANLQEFSKQALRLPSRIGASDLFGNNKTKLRDGSYYTAIGLLTSGIENEYYSEGSFGSLFRDLKKSIKSSLKQLMP
jgi:cell division protein FtsA